MKKIALNFATKVCNKLFKAALHSLSNDLSLYEKHLATKESAEYLQKMAGAKRFNNYGDFIKYCCHQAVNDGTILEFGVYSGRSINQIAVLNNKKRIVGFDSFEGLPEDWRAGFERGAFNVDGIVPKVEHNVELVKGWFSETLPNWMMNNNDLLSSIHVACDLYSSTQTIFQNINNRIKPGVVIVFDEYFNYPGWKEGEFLALQNWCKSENREYEYIAINMAHEQVAIRIIK